MDPDQLILAGLGGGFGPLPKKPPLPGTVTPQTIDELYKQENPNVPFEPIIPGLYDFPKSRIGPGMLQPDKAITQKSPADPSNMLPLLAALGGHVAPITTMAAKELTAPPAPIQNFPEIPGKVPPAQPPSPFMPMALGGAELASMIPGGAAKAIFVGPLGIARLLAAREGKTLAGSELHAAADVAQSTIDKQIKELGPGKAFEKFKVSHGPGDEVARLEFPDRDISLKPFGGQFNIYGDTVSPAQLFTLQHPDVNLHNLYGIGPIQVSRAGAKPGVDANYSYTLNKPSIFVDPTDKANLSDPLILAAALHEMQHPIQRVEGMARGASFVGSPERAEFWKFAGQPVPAGSEKTNKLIVDVQKGLLDKYMKITELGGKLEPVQQAELDAAMKVYKGEPGEAEARNVEFRFLNPSQQKRHPYDTVDPSPYQLLPANPMQLVRQPELQPFVDPRNPFDIDTLIKGLGGGK